ncbi:hypothetical protein MMC27_003721 [Xylographa pallens]|nr:hypothetical protein [Xylographa pallens]
MPPPLHPATSADLPALAALNQLVYATEPIAQIVFPDWPNPASQLPYYAALVETRFHDPRTEVFKLTDPASGAICASVCWTLVAGDEEVCSGGTAASPPPPSPLPPGVNAEFIGTIVAKLGEVNALMEGRSHFSASRGCVFSDALPGVGIAINALFVAASHQGQGLASLLVQACVAKADEAGLPTFLVSFPGAHGFYSRFGFRDVGTLEVELRDKVGGGRDLGVYTQYAMVRE